MDGPTTYVWTYRVRDDRVAAFRAAYGPDGDWARFFRRHPDYLGTELYADAGDPARFMTIDRFARPDAREELVAENRADFEALDALWEEATLEEAYVGAFGLDDGRP